MQTHKISDFKDSPKSEEESSYSKTKVDLESDLLFQSADKFRPERINSEKINLENESKKATGTEEEHSLEKKAALTTSIIAVFLAISSILGSSASDNSILYQGLTNDQWAYYQAKSIKESVYESNLQFLKIDLSDSAIDSKKLARLEGISAGFENKLKEYAAEKLAIKAKAHEYERLSKTYQKQNDIFDLAEAFYQISIVMSAISVIVRSRRTWFFSILLGAIGLAFSLQAYFVH